ncbi:MAG: hypothetical protein JWR26_1835 [Pedosphaera sp.]|nr:hypothetical protein [Pedosphaera sp.]
MDSLCPTPWIITGGMKGALGLLEWGLVGPAVARGESRVRAGALQETAEFQQSGCLRMCPCGLPPWGRGEFGQDLQDENRSSNRSIHGQRPPPSTKTEFAGLAIWEQRNELLWGQWTWMRRGAGLDRGCQKLSATSPPANRGLAGACARPPEKALRVCWVLRPSWLLAAIFTGVGPREQSSERVLAHGCLHTAIVSGGACRCRMQWNGQAQVGQCPRLSRIVPDCPGVYFMFFFSGVSHPAGVLAHGHHLGRGVETTRNHSEPLATTRGYFIFLCLHGPHGVLAHGHYGV